MVEQNVKIRADACTRSCGVGESNPAGRLFSSIRQVRLKYVDKLSVLVKYRYISKSRYSLQKEEIGKFLSFSIASVVVSGKH